MDRLESQTSQSPSGLFSIWGRYSKEATFVPEPLKPLSEEGYAKLAWLMARTDTSNLAIFKKFGQLNMFNLLRLQGELMQLQEDFCEAYNDSDYTKHRYSLKELRKSVPSEARSFNLPGSAEGSIAPNEIGVAPGLSPSNEQFRPQRPSAPPGPSASGSNTLNGSINPNLPYIPSEPYPPNGPYTPLEPDTSNPPVKHNEEADEDETYNSDDGSLYNPNYLHLLSKRIQKKLKEYNEALWQVSRLESMETPHPGSLECLQIWLVRHRGKLEEKGHKFLSGSEEFMYHESIKLNDFVSVRAPRTDRDAFQETLSPKFVSLLIFLQKKFEHWFQSKTPEKVGETSCRYSQDDHSKHEVNTKSQASSEQEKKLKRRKTEEEEKRELQIHNIARWASKFSAFVIAVTAALFPVLSMVAIYFIKRTIIRLWTLIGLTLAFALAVKFCTAARSSDIFAVAAAFVAVEAVFIGSPGKS